MKKPVIWINVNNAGQINETSDTHPASPPVIGGVWTVYAPANANLAEVLARNVELEAERDALQAQVTRLSLSCSECGHIPTPTQEGE